MKDINTDKYINDIVDLLEKNMLVRCGINLKDYEESKEEFNPQSSYYLAQLLFYKIFKDSNSADAIKTEIGLHNFNSFLYIEIFRTLHVIFKGGNRLGLKGNTPPLDRYAEFAGLPPKEALAHLVHLEKEINPHELW